MIKYIIKNLKNYDEISSYQIEKNIIKSYERYYVLGKLEIERLSEVTEHIVTIFTMHDNFMGKSSFTLSHKPSKKELDSLIKEAIMSSNLVCNKPYELVKGDKKKKILSKTIENPFELLENIADEFFKISKDNLKFNALECFYKEKETHLVNSNGVDLTKRTHTFEVESIPSYDSNEKVELYRYFTYPEYNIEKVAEDAKKALEDVYLRGEAVDFNSLNLKNKKMDVILERDVSSFFENLVYDYSFASVFRGANPKSLNELIASPKKDKLTLSLDKNSKQDFFDFEGTILNKHTIFKDNVVINYFGSKQYADYLNLTPTGVLSKIIVNKGRHSIESMTKKRHIKIIALSGLQMETLSSYVGGEIRLALYFDGEKYIPVSGLSFSGDIKEALENLEMSKELIDQFDYCGPKIIKLKGMKII